MIKISKYQVLSLLLVQIWSLQVMAANTGASGPLKTEPVGAGDFLQMFFGLLLVLGIIFGMAWFIRRMGSFQQVSHGALRILGGVSLGQRERIVLVQVGDKQLLIGLAPGQIRTLHVLEQSVTSNSIKQEQGSSFADRLQSVLQGKSRT
ncbi:MAG: flagellar biosynthetic protein FliO [Gammaproteobacteria bacterium]|nr:flagellar biosynthetic protein FliO [Gammaproteobacteria bacterium]